MTTYPSTEHVVRADDVAQYAAVFGSEPSTIPATYAAVYALADTMEQAMADPVLAIDVPRMLHGEQEFVWAAHPSIGETLTSTASVASDELRNGLRFITLRTDVRGAAGREICVGRTLQIVRSATAKRADTNWTPRPVAGSGVTMALIADVVARYADAARDHNPIHLDDSAALAAGLPGRIAHGMLTMGLFGMAAADWAGGAQRIQSLSCRFTAPVLVGDVVTVAKQTERGDGELVTVEATVHNQHGQPVLERCTARFRPEGGSR
ncbi:MaoC/PaaZ C-terminal domain-containing protein [Kribbella sp. NPDC058245]|uniref:MaoC/PaaZ C-terminal domain-containing protein n=1 Tax=Kribbella sp. NPDC058245 TaxID=3346399 RepID=UPI0036E35BDB